MSKVRHTDAQLKQVEAGRTVGDVARDCHVSRATIYTCKAKYGGLEVSEAQRLRRSQVLLEREGERVTTSRRGGSIAKQVCV